MAREGKFRQATRPAPEPTSIHEICRRYVATAATLANVMGVPLTEAFIREHRESIACCFIESGRAGVRLRASVMLPPLGAEAPVAEGQTPGEGEILRHIERSGPHVKNEEAKGQGEETSSGDAPMVIPGGLPCAGQAVAALRPAQLRMLLSRVDQLAADQGSRWRPLLESLAAERGKRIEAGRRPQPAPVGGHGHGA